MKPFQFSLNTVLDVRSNEEQVARAAQAVAQEALEAILMQRRSVEEAIESNLSACRQAFDGQVKSGIIAQLQSALRELRVQLVPHWIVRPAQCLVKIEKVSWC